MKWEKPRPVENSLQDREINGMDVVSNQTRQHIESYRSDKTDECPDPEVGKWEQQIRVGTAPDIPETENRDEVLQEYVARTYNYAKAMKCEVIRQDERILLVDDKQRIRFIVEDNRLYRIRNSVNVLGTANWDFLLKDDEEKPSYIDEDDKEELTLKRKREKAIKRNEFMDLIRDFMDEYGQQIKVNSSHPNAGKVEEEVVEYDYISPHTNKLIEVYKRRVHNVEWTDEDRKNKDTHREYENTNFRIRISSSGKSIIFGNYDKGRSKQSKKRFYLPLKQLMPFLDNNITKEPLYFKEVGSQDETDFKLFLTPNEAVGIEMPNGAVLWTSKYALNQIIKGTWDGQRGIRLSAEC